MRTVTAATARPNAESSETVMSVVKLTRVPSWCVGAELGVAVGNAVGTDVLGAAVGAALGTDVLGAAVGSDVLGAAVGTDVLGAAVGPCVGSRVGVCVGDDDGAVLGAAVGVAGVTHSVIDFTASQSNW